MNKDVLACLREIQAHLIEENGIDLRGKAKLNHKNPCNE